MIDHLSTYSTDFARTQRFYDAALIALGYSRNTEMEMEGDRDFPMRRACAYGVGTKPTFWVIEIKKAVSPRHIAFVAKDRAAVAAFYADGLGAEIGRAHV